MGQKIGTRKRGVSLHWNLTLQRAKITNRRDV